MSSGSSGWIDKLYWRRRSEREGFCCFKKTEGGKFRSLCGRSEITRTGGQKCERPKPVARCSRCDGLEAERRGWEESGPASTDQVVSARQVRRRLARGIPIDKPTLRGPSRITLTQRELAEMHGISLTQLKRRKKRSNHLVEVLAPSLTRAQPITIEGVAYSSMRAASKALGMSATKIAVLRDEVKRAAT